MSRPAATALLLALTAVAASAAAQTGSGIEYRTVAEARAAVPKRPGAKAEQKGEWLVVTEPGATSWTFTGPGHEAHPAVAKRVLLEQGGRFFIRTEIKCEAAKAPCDRLHEAFNLLDQQMHRALRQRR